MSNRNKLQQKMVMDRIRESLSSLSGRQKKVAEFFLTCGTEIVHLSTYEIAQRVNVNQSTVIRTAQKIGYEGFADLQADLQAHHLRRTGLADKFQMGSKQLIESLAEAQEARAEGTLFQKVALSEAKNMENLLKQVPQEDFENAVELMDSANRVYLIGSGASLPVVQNFVILMQYVQPDKYQLLNLGMEALGIQLSQMKSGDVLFAVSHSRYGRYILKAMEHAAHVNATVLALTDTVSSPLAKRANVVFVIPSRLWLLGHTVASFGLFNIFFSALLLRHLEEAREQWANYDQVASHFHLFDVDETD